MQFHICVCLSLWIKLLQMFNGLVLAFSELILRCRDIPQNSTNSKLAISISNHIITQRCIIYVHVYSPIAGRSSSIARCDCVYQNWRSCQMPLGNRSFSTQTNHIGAYTALMCRSIDRPSCRKCPFITVETEFRNVNHLNLATHALPSHSTSAVAATVASHLPK